MAPERERDVGSANHGHRRRHRRRPARGHLHGFLFVPESHADTPEAKTLRNAAQKALAGEIEARADRFSAAADTSLVLANDGTIRWQGDPVAKLEPGEKIGEPRLRILADVELTGPARDKVDTRLRAWLKAHIVRLLGPAIQLEDSAEFAGLARGIAFQIAERSAFWSARKC